MPFSLRLGLVSAAAPVAAAWPVSMWHELPGSYCAGESQRIATWPLVVRIWLSG
jgi:hypothetical protein